MNFPNSPPPPPEDDNDGVAPREPLAAETKKPWSKPTFRRLDDRTMSRVASGPQPETNEIGVYNPNS